MKGLWSVEDVEDVEYTKTVLELEKHGKPPDQAASIASIIIDALT